MRKKYWLHILPWSLHLLLLAFLYSIGEQVSSRSLMVWTAVTLAFQMSIFYFYYNKLIPETLRTRKLRFWSITVFIALFYPLVKIGLDTLLNTPSLELIKIDVETDNDWVQQRTWWIVEYFRRFFTPIYFISIASFARFSVDWFDNYRKQMQLEAQNLSAELALLRSQINPHFLFNTLNNIDAMVYKKAPDASEAIIKLSDLMRYMLYEANTDKVRLSQEINYIKSFIDLQKIRINKSDIVLDIEVDDESVLIAPMLFIPFVENAFKHGGRSGDAYKVQVSLRLNGGELNFSVINNLPGDKNQEKDKIGGIGLNNVKRRLELLYPAHQLNIEERDNQYIVNLSFKI